MIDTSICPALMERLLTASPYGDWALGSLGPSKVTLSAENDHRPTRAAQFRAGGLCLTVSSSIAEASIRGGSPWVLPAPSVRSRRSRDNAAKSIR